MSTSFNFVKLKTLKNCPRVLCIHNVWSSVNIRNLNDCIAYCTFYAVPMVHKPIACVQHGAQPIIVFRVIQSAVAEFRLSFQFQASISFKTFGNEIFFTRKLGANEHADLLEFMDPFRYLKKLTDKVKLHCFIREVWHCRS